MRANRASWSGIQWNTAFEKTTSTCSSSSSAVSSATNTSASGPSASRAFSTIEGEPSTAITRPRGSRCWIARVTRPLPQPASSTISSPSRGSRSSTSAAHSCCGVDTRS